MVNESQVLQTLADRNVIKLSKSAKTIGRHLGNMLRARELEMNWFRKHFAEPKCLSFFLSFFFEM